MVTQSVKIYRVNRDYYKFDSCGSNRSVLKKIMSILNEKKPKSARKTLEELSSFEENGLTYYLYVHRHKEKDSDWQKYFPVALTSVWDFKSQNLSIILFVDNDIDIFTIIGGSAFQQIVTFIDHTFGLRLLSKILDPNEDQILSINSRGLTGARSGLSEQYRNEIRVADFAKFGKLPTEVHLTLSEKVTNEYFSFLKSKPKDRIKIHVGKSFKVKKNLSFDELKLLIEEIGHIMSLEENDFLSSYIQETNRKLLKENLQPLLINKIYDDLDNVGKRNEGGDKKFRFDFCNSNKMVEFYGADRYVMKEKTGDSYEVFDETDDRYEIYEKVLRRAKVKLPNPNLFDFRTYIQGVRVLAYQDGKRVCSGSFLYHFTSEFNLGPQTVFLVDNRWYRLKHSFLQDLRFETISLAKRYRLPDNIFNKEWTGEQSEYQHNMQYHNTGEYIVFDTLTPQGIELCDVFYMGNNITYLIHVKKGFDNSMRELTNQILISSRRLYTDLKSKKKEYLHKNWDSYTTKYPEDQRFSFEKFLASFEKKIVYVLAFVSQKANNPSLIDNIDSYRSNIAKYSMIECSRAMQDYRYELNICQVSKK